MPGWAIIRDLAARMGASGFDFASPVDVMTEIASEAPIYAGVSYARLEEGSLQWPCPAADHPGTPLLYGDGFPVGRARLSPIAYRPSAEPPDADYPLLLVSERALLPYHKEILTLREDPVTRPFDEEMLKLHPQDSLRYDVGDGELVRVATRRGVFQARVCVTDQVPEGALYLTLPILQDPAPLRDGSLDQLAGPGLTGARLEKVRG